MEHKNERKNMETYHDNWNACLLFRNKQLTKQLKDYQNASALAECSPSLLVSMGQLLRLHQHPSYGLVRDEAEWANLFTVIDMLYGDCLSETLSSYGLSMQELKLCYLVRARLGNKAIAVLFNITPRSVLKAKQRIKGKLALSATDCLDKYIQQH